MKFGMCNEFCEGWRIDDVFRLAADVGYEGVEIAPFTLADSVADIPASERDRIREAASAAGVEIIGLHWLLVKPEGLYINHPDDAIRRKTTDYFVELIHFCGDLGGTRMILGSPKQRNVIEGQTLEETWNRTRAVFEEIVLVAAERGVVLCLEPLARTETNFVNTAADAARMAREIDSPNLRIILDVKAMSDEGRPIPDIIREAGDWAAHVHANDANLNGPGFGDVDFVPIFAALRDIRYDGWVSVEVFDFSPGAETIAAKSLEYLKQTHEQSTRA